jgi:hypothetical protein
MEAVVSFTVCTSGNGASYYCTRPLCGSDLCHRFVRLYLVHYLCSYRILGHVHIIPILEVEPET